MKIVLEFIDPSISWNSFNCT